MRLTGPEKLDALVLAVAGLVVLPLLPNQFFGPLRAFNPYQLWLVVVLVLLIQGAGHVARRLFGAAAGLPLAGFIGGFVSSTATISAMGARAKAERHLLQPAAAGAALSSVATILQMALLLAVLNGQLLQLLALPLILAGLGAAVYGFGFVWLGRRIAREGDTQAPGRALSFSGALLLAALIYGALFLVAGLNAWLGEAGLWVGSAVAGLADAHAALSSQALMVQNGAVAPAIAAVAVLIALSTNALSKTIIASSVGGLQFALRVVPGILLSVGLAWLGWVLASL